VSAAVTGLVHPISVMVAMVASVSTVLLNSFGGRLLPKPPIAPPPETLEKIEQITVKVPSMHCVGCADNLERAIGKIPGVRSVHADLRKKLLTVAMRDGEIGRKEICSAITTIGHVCDEE
jgi:copper chaperone CopZ